VEPTSSELRSEKYLLPVLTGGFSLIFLLLLGCALVATSAMRFVGSDAERFVAGQQAAAHLIYQVQGEEGDLSSVFYALVTGHEDSRRPELLRRLNAVEAAIHATTEGGRVAGEPAVWEKVRTAADGFIAEGRKTLLSGRPPEDELFQQHQKFLASLADLTRSNFTAAELSKEKDRISSRVRYSLALLQVALIVAVVVAIVTVNLANRMFRRLRWQADELGSLSSRVMSDHEAMARRLSHEMHDHFGQTLSAIEANLVAMQRSGSLHSGRLDDCMGLVKDAVGNVREVSQLLRPTILDDFGLDASLRWLTEGFAERTGLDVNYQSTFEGRLEESTEIQLFRIAQEALTNVSRHSKATSVTMTLSQEADRVRLSVADNGKGMEETGPRRGTGLIGMRARARIIRGEILIESKLNRGTIIRVDVPITTDKE
jgi:signal transduction histidine kinase